MNLLKQPSSANSSFSEYFAASPQAAAKVVAGLPQPNLHAAGTMNAKKRSYEPEQSFEASSDDAAPSSPLAPLHVARPPLIKAASMANATTMFGSGRRRGSERSIIRRPSLATLQGSRAPSVEISPPREDQQHAKKSRADLEGQSRPSFFKPRRAHSVCDAVFDQSNSTFATATYKGLGLGAPPPVGANNLFPPVRNSSVPTPTNDYFGFKPRHAPSASDSMSNMFGGKGVTPPIPSKAPGGFPETWGSEADGKALPCHSTKEDGLMRIMPNVVSLRHCCCRTSKPELTLPYR